MKPKAVIGPRIAGPHTQVHDILYERHLATVFCAKCLAVWEEGGVYPERCVRGNLLEQLDHFADAGSVHSDLMAEAASRIRALEELARQLASMTRTAAEAAE